MSGPLRNAKHERFAQALADGKSQFEAHGIAGYKAHRGNASLLAQDKSIVARLAEILAERESIRAKGIAKSIETTAYDVVAAMKEADEARELAIKTRNPSALVSAVTLRAKLHGLLIDRKEVREGLLDGMAPESLRALRDAIAAERARRGELDGGIGEQKPE